MMNYIWAILIFISFVFAILTNNISALSNAVLEGANEACELLLSIIGVMCFWSGMMEIAKRAKITDALAKLFSPLLTKLFPNVEKNSPAMHYISLNVSANLLGLGNAATPFGINAMKELQKTNEHKDTASDSQLLFVVLNTASVQLFPTTLCAYRSRYGSTEPFSILPSVWITSAAALIVGITVAKIFCIRKQRASPLKSPIPQKQKQMG
ncbi:MAG: spore maturation protein A [Ruminococcaceae bacterium]|nr:spore maturation protein A [Oscillospiraceae bacterium]